MSGKYSGGAQSTYIVVLSECEFSFISLEHILDDAAIDCDQRKRAFSIAQCRNILEINIDDVRSSANPVIIVTGYPGAEYSALLHKTFMKYFSKVIFLTQGQYGEEENLYFLNIRNSLPALKQAFSRLVFNHDMQEQPQGEDNALSSREQYFLKLLREGLDTRAIAKSMKVSIATVYSYRRKICHKVGARNLQEMVIRRNNQIRQPVPPPACGGRRESVAQQHYV